MAMQLIWHMFSALTQQGVSAVYLEVPASVIMIHLLQISWTQSSRRRIISKVPVLTKSPPAKVIFTFQKY